MQTIYILFFVLFLIASTITIITILLLLLLLLLLYFSLLLGSFHTSDFIFYDVNSGSSLQLKPTLIFNVRSFPLIFLYLFQQQLWLNVFPILLFSPFYVDKYSFFNCIYWLEDNVTFFLILE